VISGLLFHADHAGAPAAAGGSPLYDVAPEHTAALLVTLAALVVAWLAGRRLARSGRPRRLLRAWDALTPLDRLAAGGLVGSAVIHLVLAATHGPPGLRLLFAADAVALGLIARRLMRGRGWRGWATLVLVGSLGAWWVAVVTGEPPDQLGLATKLVELGTLAAVLRPRSAGPLRAAAATALVIGLVVVTDIAAWVGAFAATDGGHHASGVAPPGSVQAAPDGTAPTAEPRAAADALWAATAAGIGEYSDPARAAADGYVVAGIGGTDFHAMNPVHEHDDRVLDPQRPEALVYGSTPDGRPVLLGAMFVMPELRGAGPEVGGSLTTWHAHEQICFSLTPPALTGILSPLGSCPAASITLPLTAEMIHVWTVPGAPDRFGDLDHGWRTAYLASR
jgi:hypothetical protein